MQQEFYAGSIVFADFKGNLIAPLTIRSIHLKDGVATTQAAAGLVAQSCLDDELAEKNNKLRAALTALQLANQPEAT